MRPIDSTDIAFIEATFSDPDWNPISISEKLCISEQTVRTYAKKLGLKKPSTRFTKRIYTAQHDWESLYYARMSRMSYSESAEAAGMKLSSARCAMERMINMTEAERIYKWNLYREKHGMPLFAKC